jgi:hypothetical protein
MKKVVLGLLAVIGITLVSVSPSLAFVWDATADFSITNGNANGVWSYGWMPIDYSSFNIYESSRIYDYAPHWYREGSGDYTPCVWRVDGAVPRYGVEVGQLALHSSPGSEPSVVRWTAPYEGDYLFVGMFLAGDGGVMQVGIRQGDNWLWQSVDSGYFNIDKKIAKDVSIDFLVYGGYAYGSTPLELTISSSGQPIPEPATLSLFGLGLLGLVFKMRV